MGRAHSGGPAAGPLAAARAAAGPGRPARARYRDRGRASDLPSVTTGSLSMSRYTLYYKPELECGPAIRACTVTVTVTWSIV
jgi:hypothetical protein